MSRDAVLLFLSLLALGAEAAIVALIVTAVGGRFTARARWWVVQNLGPHATLLAFVVAAVATAGSLYLSEVANFTPCTLCWYQRIAMYPLVVLLGIATWRRDDVVALRVHARGHRRIDLDLPHARRAVPVARDVEL